MSDADVASAFAAACFAAERHAAAGYRPRPANSSGPPEPVWDALRAAVTPRVRELAGVAGVELGPADVYGVSPADLCSVLESLCEKAGAVKAHFADLRRNDPPAHARGSLRRIAAEIPQLRDHGLRGFVHRVAGRFDPSGAADELRPFFESVADLAQVLGFARPRGWKPNPINEWSDWCDEWNRLAGCIREVLGPTPSDGAAADIAPDLRPSMPDVCLPGPPLLNSPHARGVIVDIFRAAAAEFRAVTQPYTPAERDCRRKVGQAMLDARERGLIPASEAELLKLIDDHRPGGLENNNRIRGPRALWDDFAGGHCGVMDGPTADRVGGLLPRLVGLAVLGCSPAERSALACDYLARLIESGSAAPRVAPPVEPAPAESPDKLSELSFELLKGSVRLAGIGGKSDTAPMVDGFYYIARLLQTPGKPVSISELVSCRPTQARSDGLSDDARSKTHSIPRRTLAEADALETTDFGNDPVADEEAIDGARGQAQQLEADITRYRQEIAEAEKRGEEAEANDSRRALQKALVELEGIKSWLLQVTGYAGKPRTMPRPRGLSASNIHGRLKGAYKQLKDYKLGEYADHFQPSIGQDGQAFVYNPSPPLGAWRVIGIHPAGEH
jgi:hypothetical protein